MAVFGMQLVVTMIMASVLSKVLPHYSFAKWLLCKTGEKPAPYSKDCLKDWEKSGRYLWLTYYLHPSDEELKVAAGIPKKTKSAGGGGKGSGKNSGRGRGGAQSGNAEAEDPSAFNVPRNTEISLEKSAITPMEVMGLRFYSDYQWLVDFSVCSAIVYTISEIYIYALPPKGEVNLSMLWCLLVVGFALKVMFSLTMLYFHGEESGGEKAMVILSFFIYLLIALGMLIISEEKLDLGLDLAYASFNQSSAAFLKAQGLNSQGPASKVTFKIVLAFMCGLIGAFYTFPGMRLGKMHWDSLRFCGDRRLRRLIFHASFLSPILLILLWVRPISRRYFTEVIFTGYSQPIMTSGMFDITRLVLVAVVGVIRIAMMPLYLQSYLNMAYEKIEELKKETGKISNKHFQRKIARVFYYLCVVTLQYVAPVIMCIFLSLMCKTLGGLQWRDLVSNREGLEECGLSPDSSSDVEFSTSPLSLLHQAESVSEASKTLSLGLEELKKIFTTEFYRGVLGFSTWWCVFSLFLSSTFGVLYQSYFTQG